VTPVSTSKPTDSIDAERSLRRYPQYELDCLFDEEETPSEVTVFVDEVGELATKWLTIDIDHAVPLDEVR
jgi:hypothetical protein